MKFSYGITVCNEHEELNNLLQYLLNQIDDEDEIVVVYDKNRVTVEVLSILYSHKNSIPFFSFDFKDNFLEYKNFLNSKCSGDYIFQLDADEIPSLNLVKNGKTILKSNTVEVLIIARRNIVSGITAEHIRKWNWKINENGWCQWPDKQKRIYKNSKEIIWTGHQLHGTISGYKSSLDLPLEEEWSILHDKNIDKQESQNNRYEQIEREQLR